MYEDIKNLLDKSEKILIDIENRLDSMDEKTAILRKNLEDLERDIIEFTK
jgi:hypothetical protein